MAATYERYRGEFGFCVNPNVTVKDNNYDRSCEIQLQSMMRKIVLSTKLLNSLIIQNKDFI